MKIVQFMASKKYVGAERSFVELSNELSKNNEVYAIVVRGCEYKNRFFNKVNVIELKSNPSRYNPFLYYEIYKILKTLNPNIVHTHSAKATEIIYRLWKFMKFPFIATKRNSRKSKIFDKIPFVVAVSKEVARGIKNKNLEVIYNGIDCVKVFHKEKEEVFTIIAIGALRKVKNFDQLIESVANLSFDFQLWIVGEGEERSALQLLIQKYSLNTKVLLLGYKDNIFELLSKAHLQIINSHREGFSRALIEGVFYSDVVISTPVGGSVEILPEELLFKDAKSKIVAVYEQYEWYKEIFKKVKKQYQPILRLERVAKEYEKLYKRILNV